MWTSLDGHSPNRHVRKRAVKTWVFDSWTDWTDIFTLIPYKDVDYVGPLPLRLHQR